MSDGKKRSQLAEVLRELQRKCKEPGVDPITLLADARGDLQRMREDWEQAARRQGGAR